ncbi:hypothetical protein MUK42_03723, partial [Musa troglodytarum]
GQRCDPDPIDVDNFCNPSCRPQPQPQPRRDTNILPVLLSSAAAVRIQMAAMPTPAAFDGPVVVVGPQFCAPHVVDLTVTRKAFSWTGNDFTVTDVNGNVVLKVKGVYFSLRDRRVLLDAAGKPPHPATEELECAPKMASVQRREHRFERPAVQRQEVQAAAI